MRELSPRRRHLLRTSLAVAVAIAALTLACTGIVGVKDLTFTEGTDSGIAMFVSPDSGDVLVGMGSVDSGAMITGGGIGPADGSASSDGSSPSDGGGLVDGATDSGACPVDCLGGVCAANVCQPAVAASFTVINDLRIDDTQMYISADVQGFYQKTKLGNEVPGAVATFGTNTNMQAWTMSRTGANLYLLERNVTAGTSSIFVVPATGASGTLYSLYTIAGGGYLLNVAGAGPDASVYFSDDAGMHQVLADGGQLHLDTAGLERWVITDGGGHILAPSPTQVWDFGVVDDVLSTADYYTPAGGSPVLASDDKLIYFAAGATSTIESLPLGIPVGATPAVVTTVGTNITGLTADGRALYALAKAPASADGYALYRCPSPCTKATVLVSGLISPSLLRMDGTALYFVDVGGGTSTVQRIARPLGG